MAFERNSSGRIGRGANALAACAALFAGIALVACGGSSERATFPANLGSRFASQADRVGALLDDRDTCAALDEARTLRRSVAEEVEAGRIPRGLKGPLLARVEDVIEGIRCVEPAPAPAPEPGPAPPPVLPDELGEEHAEAAEPEAQVEEVGEEPEEDEEGEDGDEDGDSSGPGSGEESGEREDGSGEGSGEDGGE
jgi:hypothetical protein